MKIIITGCSHSTGTEMRDFVLFSTNKDYEDFLLSMKNNPKIYYQTRWQYIFNHILKIKKHRKKKYKSLSKIITNPAYSHDVLKRYWGFVERNYSWSKNLQVKIPNHEVISLAKGGTGFKYSLKMTLQTLKKNNDQIIFIHQVPSTARTYRKIDGKFFHFSPGLQHLDQYTGERGKWFDKIQKIWKTTVSLDAHYGHFNNCLKKYLSILKNHGGQRIQNYFICYDTDQRDIILEQFGNEQIILSDLKKYMSQYKFGGGHVIDKKFNDDLSSLVEKKLSFDFR